VFGLKVQYATLLPLFGIVGTSCSILSIAIGITDYW